MYASEEHIRRERERARELRRSRWWQSRIASSTCYYCNTPLNARTATMDHLLPLASGGFSTRGNVVPCCKACNSAKQHRSAGEFALENQDACSRPAISPVRGKDA